MTFAISMSMVPTIETPKSASLLATTMQPARLVTCQLQNIGDVREGKSTGLDVDTRQALHWALNNIFLFISLEYCAKLIQKPHCTEKETKDPIV